MSVSRSRFRASGVTSSLTVLTITPPDLSTLVREAGPVVDGLKGLTYNPLTQIYSLNQDTDVNYMIAARKHG